VNNMPKIGDDGGIFPRTRPYAYHDPHPLPPWQPNFLGGEVLRVEFGPESRRNLDRLATAVERLTAQRAIARPHGSVVHAGVDVIPAAVWEQISTTLAKIGGDHQRIADHFDPPPSDIVGTDYISRRLGCTKVWVTDMARNGQIPKGCIVAGTGNGKPWKFHRRRIDEWLATR
jgi:hypothetical protein